jgi:predicted DNA-binding protein YlxM (UPF0122 family)
MPVWNKIVLNRDELQRLYINEGLSILQIAKSFNLSKGPIHRMLHEYKIPVYDSKEASVKVKVTKKQLKDWYVKDKLSMFQIADKLGCTHSAIVYKFKKFNLKSRGHLGLTKPINLTKMGFEHLYYKRGLSLKKIANIAHCSESGLERRFKVYNLKSRTTLNRAARIKKFDFSGDLIEKAYLIGFRLGDLNIMKKVSVTQVRCSSTIFAQIRLIKQLFSKYSTPKIVKYIDRKFKIPKWDIVFLVNRSFDFLVPKEDEIPLWIQKDKQLFFSFLAGYSDAEGSFVIHKGKPKNKIGFGVYEIGSQQKHIIIQIWENLLKYGIQISYPIISKKAGYTQSNGMKNNKDFWHLSTARKDSVCTLIREIEAYIKHPNKIRELAHVKENVNLRLINNPYRLA